MSRALNIGSRLREALVSLRDGAFLAVILVLFSLLSAPLFLHWPPPMADEEMFGDVARTLAEESRFASTLVAGQEQWMYWQPPLYFVLLAPVIKTFGWSLEVVRGFSAMAGMLIVALTFLFARSFTSQLAARIGTVLLVCNPFFVIYIKYGRMDALCVLFILASLLLARRAIQRPEPARFVLPGVAAAAAVLTHPLGLIAPLTVLLWLLVSCRKERRRLARSVAWLALPIIAALSLWLILILQDPHAFVVQMQYQFTRKDRGWFNASLGFLERYRFLPFVLATGIAGTIGTWAAWRARNDGALLLLVLANVVTFVIVATRFELPYHVYWAPLASIAASIAVTSVSLRWQRGVGLLAFLALVNGLAFFAYVSTSIHWKERSAPSYSEFSRTVATVLPPSASIMNAGYPSLYWGLHKESPAIRYCEKVYFDSTLARNVVGSLDYFIITRSFDPNEDAELFRREMRSIDSLAARVNKKLVLVGEIGEERQFVPSAKVYRFVPSTATGPGLP